MRTLLVWAGLFLVVGGATAQGSGATVTSRDGTRIAFDKTGAGPAIILVNGALQDRALDPSMAQLAALLSERFTVYNYDRRGRGESGNTLPFSKAREIEDLQALVHDAGTAMVLGFSSGSVLALDAAAVTPGMTKLAVYEPPLVVDAGRPGVGTDYVDRLNQLLAAGKPDQAVEYFLVTAVGIPAEYAAGAKQDPRWPSMVGLAPTLAYDGSFVVDLMQGKPLPTHRWTGVTVPTLVLDGGDSQAWMHSGAAALVKVLPHASARTLAGQSHDVDPTVLAPAVVEFFQGGR